MEQLHAEFVEQLNAEVVEQQHPEVVEQQFAEIVAAGADQSSVDLDVDHQAPLLGLLSTPRRPLKRACSCGTDDRVRFRKRIRILQQSVRRLKIRCKSMDGIVKELRSRDLVDEHLGTAPNSRFAGMQLSLLKHQVCCIVLLADQFVRRDVASRGGRPGPSPGGPRGPWLSWILAGAFRMAGAYSHALSLPVCGRLLFTARKFK